MLYFPKPRKQSSRESQFKVIQMWEHEFLNLKKMDESLKELLTELEDQMNSREAFYSGE